MVLFKLRRIMRKTYPVTISLLMCGIFLYAGHLEHTHTHTERFYESSTAENPSIRPLRMQHNRSSQTNVITIFSWNKKFGYRTNWFTPGTFAFEDCDLPENMPCTYTSDRSQYNSSHAVLIRIRQLKHVTDLPTYRLPGQKWIFYETEPPTKTWSYLPKLNPDPIRGLFNMTSTYAIDSTVASRLPMSCVKDQEKYDSLDGVDFHAEKTKDVVWFVSHCETNSKREDYVRELQKYIQVDVFGACGNMSCNDVKLGNENAFRRDEMLECDKLILNATYKFYLAFENSLCKNYVTEKLTRIVLNNINIIPVVMGYENYNSLLPSDSFIDVRNFTSPQDLAHHLNEISQNRDLFNNCMKNKNSLKCSAPREVKYECRLCRYLHEHRRESEMVSDAVEYWSVQNQCLTATEYFRQQSK